MVGDELLLHLTYFFRSWQNKKLPNKIWQTVGDAISNSEHLRQFGKLT
jgi:hypothetical protein